MSINANGEILDVQQEFWSIRQVELEFLLEVRVEFVNGPLAAAA